MLLRFLKDTARKDFVLNYWFNNKADFINLGTYPQIRCKEIEKKCLELAETHQDDRGLWIKNTKQTRIDEKRIVEKPDTTKPKGYTINKVIEAYCGAALPGEQTERGFSKDRKEGYRRAKSRYLQNIVKDKIIKLFNLTNADIRTSNTGKNGEDVKLLSITAKRALPYSVECKNAEQNIGLYKNFK